jgi:hypothetical protein
MTPARLAGVLFLLLPVLAGCGGHRETALEHQIRTYINSNQRYFEILRGEPFDAKVDRLRCRDFSQFFPGRDVSQYGCDITLRAGTADLRAGTPYRWVGSRRNGKFSFAVCVGQRGERVIDGGGRPYPPCDDPLG